MWHSLLVWYKVSLLWAQIKMNYQLYWMMETALFPIGIAVGSFGCMNVYNIEGFIPAAIVLMMIGGVFTFIGMTSLLELLPRYGGIK